MIAHEEKRKTTATNRTDLCLNLRLRANFIAFVIDIALKDLSITLLLHGDHEGE